MARWQAKLAALVMSATDPLDRVSKAVCAVLMATLATVLVVQVVARYGFSTSFDRLVEVPRITFIIVIYLGMPLAYREGMHVGMNVLSWALPPDPVRHVTRITCLVMISTIVVVLYFALTMAAKTWTQPSIKFPVGGFYLAIAYGCGHLLLHIFRSLLAGDFAQSADPID